MYGYVKAVTSDEIPELLRYKVTLTTHINTNLYHDIVTGCSVAGIVYITNGTLFEWYSRKKVQWIQQIMIQSFYKKLFLFIIN